VAFNVDCGACRARAEARKRKGDKE